MDKSKIKKKLRRELSSRKKYKTTYKDIKYYFDMINKVVFKNKLSPFNEILIKKIYKDKKSCTHTWGHVVCWEWKRKCTKQYWLEMLPEYNSKILFNVFIGSFIFSTGRQISFENFLNFLI